MKKILSCLAVLLAMVLCVCTGCSGENSDNLESLRNQITELQEQIQELQDQLGDAKDQNDELQDRIEGLQDQLDCLQDKLADFLPIPERPEDTNLEFWITQDVAGYDFSEYEEELGWFGCRVYYGKGYHPTEIREGCDSYMVDPEHCVKYTVGSYPDEADRESFITRIEITDPNVTVYGLTCESSCEEFREAFRRMGFSVSYNDWGDCSASFGKVHFRLHKSYGKPELRIVVEVTNETGIVY